MNEILKRACAVTFVALLVASMLAPFIGFVGTAEAAENTDLVFAASGDNTIRAFERATGNQVWSNSYGTAAQDVEAGPEGEYVYGAIGGGSVVKLHASNGTQVWSTSAPGRAYEVEVYSDNSGVLVGDYGNDQIIKLDPSDGSTIWAQAVKYGTTAMEIGPNDNYVYYGDYYAEMGQMDLSTQTEQWRVVVGSSSVEAIEPSSDGSVVYAGDIGNGYVAEYSTSNGARNWRVAASFSQVNQIDLGPDENELAVGTSGNLEVMAANGGTSQYTATPHGGNGVYELVVSSDSWIYSGDDLGNLARTDMSTGSVDYNLGRFNGVTNGMDLVTVIKSSVSGTVTDAQNGTGIDNATIEAYQSNSLIDSASTDNSGNYNLSLEDGDYTFKVLRSGYENTERSVTVSGKTTADFELDGIYDIDGYVKENTKEGEPISDANIKVFQNGTQEHSAVTNSSGYYKITSIVGGNYTFNVSALGYQNHSSEKYIDSSKQIGFRLNNKEDEYVPYMEFKTPAWIPSNDSRAYHVYFSDENKDYKEVTKDANVTSLNVSRVKVNTSSLELEGQAGINATVNVTAEYTYKGTKYKQTNELVVAKLELAQVEILPPSHRVGAFARDSNIQMIIVAIMLGVVAAYLTRNPYAGMGGIQLVLMIAWANDRLNTGILLVGFYYMLFAGMLSMKIRKGGH